MALFRGIGYWSIRDKVKFAIATINVNTKLEPIPKCSIIILLAQTLSLPLSLKLNIYYHLSTVYMGILNMIPRNWKDRIEKKVSDNLRTFWKCEKHKKSCQYLYRTFFVFFTTNKRTRKMDRGNKYRNWDWGALFKIPFSCTKNNKYAHVLSSNTRYCI